MLWARSSVAERAAHNRLVEGSIPSGPTSNIKLKLVEGPIARKGCFAKGCYSFPSGPTFYQFLAKLIQQALQNSLT